jgi:hypothetical protein
MAGVSGRRSCRGRWLRGRQEGEEFLDGQVGFCWGAQGAVQVEGVVRAAAVPPAGEVVGFFEVADDAVGGAFGDVAGRGEVAEARGGVAGDGQQYPGVAGEKATCSMS